MKKGVKPILFLSIFVLLLVVTLNALRNFSASKTIGELLTENKYLKESLTNLMQEDQIGYAKVTSKEYKDGKLYTGLKFVETARDDKLKKILEKKYIIEGDVIHFDALIVKFGDKMVMDGKNKALYLWRRVYSEKTAPENGFAIEQPGQQPERYADLLKKLNLKDRELFWSNIWDLANEPEKLKSYGIEAIYGNAVYHQLRAGLIYVFKITPTGQVHPEIVPEM
jgi:hypothetical protein